MYGTSRTCLFNLNSSRLCKVLPKPLISISNCVPSPVSPALSLRAPGVVGFHLGKLATSMTVWNTSSTGLWITWVSFRIAMGFLTAYLFWRSKRPCVKNNVHLYDFAFFHTEPFRNRSDKSGYGLEIKDAAYLRAVHELLL